MAISFEVTARCPETGARVGKLHTPHGSISTPVFMPCWNPGHSEDHGTGGIKEAGAEIILSNTYHLYLRPGDDLIAEAGGLHAFMNWDRAIFDGQRGLKFSASCLPEDNGRRGHFSLPHRWFRTLYFPGEGHRDPDQPGGRYHHGFDECIPYPCTYEYARNRPCARPAGQNAA